MVRRQLVSSRAQAVSLIETGQVLVGGSVADKPARLVSDSEPVLITAPARRYVGRGGEKLAAALDHFAIDPAGSRALDVGASTGGFTDCLLQRGAIGVTALDVGRGQLHERLRSDPRVEVRERTDIRAAVEAGLEPASYDLIVVDVSFISLRTVASWITPFARSGADVVALIKPQFEAGKAEVSRGKGVVRDPETWRRAMIGAITAFEAAGATIMGVMVSPLRGADGNVEFLAHLGVHAQPSGPPPAAGAGIGAIGQQAVERALDDASRLVADRGR